MENKDIKMKKYVNSNPNQVQKKLSIQTIIPTPDPFPSILSNNFKYLINNDNLKSQTTQNN